MRHRLTVVLTALATAAACSGEGPNEPAPPAPAVQLRDIVVSRLPSPYYHFDYGADGRVSSASFASGFTMYDVSYDGDRIKEMRTNIIVNHDRLVYFYDDAGRVFMVNYVDEEGVVFTRLELAYDGPRLTTLERSVRVSGGFVIDKVMSLAYHPDGNLRQLTDHRPRIDGVREATTTVDRFEEYDDGINVDAFSLLHNDFFDHLVLLPGVVLQQGNPRRQVRTGGGTNFEVDYTYTYDDRRRPLTKTGDVAVLSGPTSGSRFQSLTEFSYY